MFQFKSEGRRNQCSCSKTIGQEKCPPIHGRTSLFWALQPSTDWMRPTHAREQSPFQYTDSNVNLIQKQPPRCTWNNAGPNIWAPCASVKLTHKINCHGFLFIYLGLCFLIHYYKSHSFLPLQLFFSSPLSRSLCFCLHCEWGHSLDVLSQVISLFAWLQLWSIH